MIERVFVIVWGGDPRFDHFSALRGTCCTTLTIKDPIVDYSLLFSGVKTAHFFKGKFFNLRRVLDSPLRVLNL